MAASISLEEEETGVGDTVIAGGIYGRPGLASAFCRHGRCLPYSVLQALALYDKKALTQWMLIECYRKMKC